MVGLVMGDLGHGGQALCIESAAQAAWACQRRGVGLAGSTDRVGHDGVVSGDGQHSTGQGTRSPPISCASPCKECRGASPERTWSECNSGAMLDECLGEVELRVMRRQNGWRRRMMFQKVAM